MFVAPSKKFTTLWFGAKAALVNAWVELLQTPVWFDPLPEVVGVRQLMTAVNVYAWPELPYVLAVSVIEVVPFVNVCTNTGEVLAMKVAFPPKAAVMLWVPP